MGSTPRQHRRARDRRRTRRPGRRLRGHRRRKAGHDPRAGVGERTSAARRSGRSAGSCSSTPRAAPDGREGRPGARPAGLARHRRLRPRRGPLAAASGRRPTSSSRRARSGRGCSERGIGFFPVVGWAERGGGLATGHGNSVPAVPHHVGHRAGGRGARSSSGCARRSPTAARRCCSATGSTSSSSRAVRSSGRAEPCSRRTTPSAARPPTAIEVGDFEHPRRERRSCASGGIGGNFDLVRKHWPAADGSAAGGSRCPASRRSSTAGCSPSPRMRVPTSSTRTACGPTPRASATGRRSGRTTASASCPGPRACWLDATGRRLPAPNFPGFDTVATTQHIGTTGHQHTWFVLTQSIIEKEFALSGSEQNPDLTGKSVRELAKQRLGKGATGRSRRSWSTARTSWSPTRSTTLLDGMERLSADITGGASGARPRPGARRDRGARPRARERLLEGRAAERDPPVRGTYRGDKLIRVAKPHRILDPKHGPADRACGCTCSPASRWAASRPTCPAAPSAPTAPRSRPVRCGRGERLRRRRDARLPRARGHLPRRLHLQRPHRGKGRRVSELASRSGASRAHGRAWCVSRVQGPDS